MKRHSYGFHVAMVFMVSGLTFSQLSCKKVSIKPIVEKKDTASATETGGDTGSDTGTDSKTDIASDTGISSDTSSVYGTDTTADTGTNTTSETAVDTNSDTMLDSATDSETAGDQTDTDTISDTESATETASDGNGTLVWAKNTGSGTTQWGRGVAALPDGSFLVTGTFDDKVTFGAQEANETSLTSAGFDDIFVAKYDPEGALIWVKRAGGASYDASFDIVALSDGSCLVTGYFEKDAIFGPGEVNQTSFIEGEGIETFIAKYKVDGSLAWAKRGSSLGLDWGVAIASLPDSSFFLTGNFEGTISLGLSETRETSLTAEGEMDIFLAKFSQDGALVWAVSMKGTDYDWGSDITALPDNSVLLVGVYDGTARFGVGKTNETAISSAGGTDVFIAKFSSEGTFAWAKTVGGALGDWVGGIAFRPDSSFLISGYFEGTTILGMGESRETQITATGSRDVFVAEFAPDGSLNWAKRAGGNNLSRANDIAISPDGSGIIMGYFEENITFGTGETHETTLMSSGDFDVFLAKVASDGSLVWATRAGGEHIDKGNDMALCDGYAIVTGYFAQNAVFGSEEAGEITLNAIGDEDMFIAKFDI